MIWELITVTEVLKPGEISNLSTNGFCYDDVI